MHTVLSIARQTTPRLLSLPEEIWAKPFYEQLNLTYQPPTAEDEAHDHGITFGDGIQLWLTQHLYFHCYL